MASVLVVTPSLTGGSWISIQRSLSALADVGWTVHVVALGRAEGTDPRFQLTAVPFPRYDKHGWLATKSRLIGFAWNLPLLLLGLFFALKERPPIVIHNGFTSALTLGPAVRRLGSKSVVMYHGYVDPAVWDGGVMKAAAKTIDLAVVNSPGSRQNLAGFMPDDRVVVSEHYADEALFQSEIARADQDAPLTVLYVGRLDPDKLCDALVRAAGDPRTKDLRFVFVGVGAFAPAVENLVATHPNVEYLGYVSDRAKLIELYTEADVVWSYADESYLALPAVEALAAGRPVIVPRLVAIADKAARGVTVGEGLVPSEAGWIIDTTDDHRVVELLAWLGREGVPPGMPAAARACARARYSPHNLRASVDAIQKLREVH
jgi:glycosyltransferase involved in cell wall biosynthesis